MALEHVTRPPQWDDCSEGPPDRVLLLVRRSTLILPVNVRRFVEKAYLRGSDAIMLDLEDSIPEAEKAPARTCVAEAAALAGKGGADVLIRLNKPFRHVVRDLEAAIIPGVTGVVLPKAESGDEVKMLDGWIGELERERRLPGGKIQISCLIETARGVARADEIATASSRLVSISLGTEDYTLDLDIRPTASGHEVVTAQALVVMAARRAGIQALGLRGSLADFTDLEGLERSARLAREAGCWGASCIHPAQIAVLNRAFSPSADAVEYARRVISAYEEAERQGRASVALEGKMIDIPVLVRAQRLLARAEAIEQYEAKRRAALAAGGEAGR